MKTKKDLKLLESELKKHPDNIGLKVRYAKLLFKVRDIAQSESVYQSILKQDPNNVQAKQGLLEVYFEKENYSAVLVIAEELHQKKQASEKSIILHIKSLLKQNAVDEAQTLYNKLISNNPFVIDDELMAVFEDTSILEEDAVGKSGDYESEFEDYDDDYDEEDFDEFDDDDYEMDVDARDMLNDFEQIIVQREGDLSFTDVIGMQPIKTMLRFKFSLFNSFENILSRNERPIRSSVLLMGPPGCGKSHIVRALINEFYCPVIALHAARSIILPRGTWSNYVDLALNYAFVIKPIIIYADHLEDYCPDQALSPERILLNFDEMRQDWSEIGLVATSSKPWLIDESIFRYGKIDDVCFVAPPTPEERAEFLDAFLFVKNKGLKSDSRRIVEATRGFSYAELALAIERALFLWWQERTSKRQKLSVDAVLRATTTIRPVVLDWQLALEAAVGHDERRKHLFQAALSYVVQ